jgi:predicted AlkP superfamily phosphohydrolase/phosphomutase
LKRAFVFGLDAIVFELMEKWMTEGKLPNLANLAREGVIANNCMVPLPSLTPSNWTTIATGACPATHGITDFTVFHPGDPLNVTYSGFNSKECRSEHIWTAAERSGKRSILIKYPASWPPTIQKGIQIDGCHVHECIHEIDVPHLFSTEDYPLSTKIGLKEAKDWKNIPPSQAPYLETRISLGSIKDRRVVGRKLIDEYFDSRINLDILIIDPNGKGYSKIIVSKDKDTINNIATLGKGEWTDWIFEKFPGSLRNPIHSFDTYPLYDGSRMGAFKLALLDLSDDANVFKLYSSHISPIKGMYYPESIGLDLTKKVGPFPIECGWFGVTRGWFGLDTFMKILEWRNQWFTDASRYLMENYKWDLYFMQAHTPDLMGHLCLSKADPLTAKNKEESQQNLQAIERMYLSCDKMIGKILEKAKPEDLKVVVSDHGAKTHLANVNIINVLEDAELLYFKEDQETGIRYVDWSRTKAVPQRTVHIYINLKGRDPNGIVEHGKEYEEVRDKIIDALYDYKDPKTGKKAFSLVLRREDARILGLYGEGVGDIIYSVNPEFNSEHGQHLSTAKLGLGSMKGTLIMAGPGIKKNYVIEKTIWLMQVAPTISYLMDIYTPKDTEGAIIYEALEDMDLKLKEKKNLKKQIARWKDAYEKQVSIRHDLTL